MVALCLCRAEMQFFHVLEAEQKAHSFGMGAALGIFSLHWNEPLPFPASLETGRDRRQEAPPSNFQALSSTCHGSGHNSHTSAAFVLSGFGPSCPPEPTSCLETAAREGCKGVPVTAGVLRDITRCHSSQFLEERL